MPASSSYALALAGAALLAGAPSAHAQHGQIVQSVAAPVPLGGGMVQGAAGDAGGILTGAAPALAAQLEQDLGGSPGGGRPTGPPPAGGGSAPSGGAATPVLEGGVLDFALGSLLVAAPPIGSVVAVDGTPPSLGVRIVSTLRQVHRSGDLKLLVRLDEPGVVALRGALRPGRRAGRARGRHSRRLVRVPPTMLAFRRRGALTVSIQLGRAARRTLGRSRSARLQVLAVAVDVARNQTPARRKLHVTR